MIHIVYHHKVMVLELIQPTNTGQEELVSSMNYQQKLVDTHDTIIQLFIPVLYNILNQISQTIDIGIMIFSGSA